MLQPPITLDNGFIHRSLFKRVLNKMSEVTKHKRNNLRNNTDSLKVSCHTIIAAFQPFPTLIGRCKKHRKKDKRSEKQHVLYSAVSTLVIILLNILITSVILFSSLTIPFFVCKKAAKVLYNRKTFIYSVVMYVYLSNLTFQTTDTNLQLS